MMGKTYKAWVVEETDGNFKPILKDLPSKKLEENQVRVVVKASSINFKDYLSMTGNKGVTREYPHVTGIDACGIVKESTSSEWKENDEVIITGFDLGMNTDGGHAEEVVAPANWLVKMPENSNEDRFLKAMAWGTAGFTATQLVEKIIEHPLPPSAGKVAVSGASGNVGCMAIALLSHLGYETVALTRDGKEKDWLMSIGAKEVLENKDWLNEKSIKRPILKGIYSSAIDTLGGEPLAVLLKSISYRGIVSCCGMVAGGTFNASVFPFILRGVTLAGVDSAECPIEQKKKLWEKMYSTYALPNFEDIYSVIGFEEIPDTVMKLKDGSTRGRIVIKIS